jgi:DNA-binding FadR family transcriptional regulator
MDAGTPVLDRLEEHLRAQGFGEGDRLPPERSLAPALGVSRRALREALARLELQGRVWRGVGQGTWLGSRPGAPSAAASRAAAASHPLAVMEARLALEPALAALAALKATAEDAAAIARCAARGAETHDEESWGHWDAGFHRAIAQASGNALLREAFAVIEASRARTEWGRLREAVATAAMRRDAAEQHAAVAEAIARRDMDAARQAMWDHLRSVNRAIESVGAGLAQGTPPTMKPAGPTPGRTPRAAAAAPQARRTP